MLLRVYNLGTFSLWLDEVFTMRVASLPILGTLTACAADAENVPFYAVMTHFGLALGLTDPLIRLLPIAAAIASIGLLAVWTRRHFGPTTAFLVAGFCGLSPFHIRYSQELRAYPYLLLMCAATLVLSDRLRTRPDRVSTIALAGVVALGCYTNLTYPLILVPVAGSVFWLRSPEGGGAPRSTGPARWRFLVAVGLGGLAFVPWIWWIWTTLAGRLARARTTEWSLEAVGQRWQGLTIAYGHFDRLSWFGAVLALCFIIGVVVAARLRIGRVVLLPAVATLVAWELVLVAVRHWSAARYDTALWPFLAVLTAIGFERVLALLHWRWLQRVAGAAVVAMMLVQVDAYHRYGRPHWDELAAAVGEVRRPEEAVIAVDDWTRQCLGYYLHEPLSSLNRKPYRLRARLVQSPSMLVVSRRPLTPGYLALADARTRIVDIHHTGILYRLQMDAYRRSAEDTTDDDGPARPWPDPAFNSVSLRLEQLPGGVLGPLGKRRRPTEAGVSARVELGPGDRSQLLSGWGPAMQRPGGTTWAWVLGSEASVTLSPAEPRPGRIAIRLWPHRDVSEGQRVRLVLNGHVVGEKPLRPGPQVIGFGVPARMWRSGRGVLVLQFSRLCCDTGPGQPRPAGVDWIRWTPRSQNLPRRMALNGTEVATPQQYIGPFP